MMQFELRFSVESRLRENNKAKIVCSISAGISNVPELIIK